jgi:hypothetical protein
MLQHRSSAVAARGRGADGPELPWEGPGRAADASEAGGARDKPWVSGVARYGVRGPVLVLYALGMGSCCGEGRCW